MVFGRRNSGHSVDDHSRTFSPSTSMPFSYIELWHSSISGRWCIAWSLSASRSKPFIKSEYSHLFGVILTGRFIGTISRAPIGWLPVFTLWWPYWCSSGCSGRKLRRDWIRPLPTTYGRLRSARAIVRPKRRPSAIRQKSRQAEIDHLSPFCPARGVRKTGHSANVIATRLAGAF